MFSWSEPLSTIYAHKGAACERNCRRGKEERRKYLVQLGYIETRHRQQQQQYPTIRQRDKRGEKAREEERETHQVTFLLNTVT